MAANGASGTERPQSLLPAAEVGHVAGVLAEVVALDQREALLDELEEVPAVERVEGPQVGQERVEVEARVEEVAADADLVLVDDQALLLLPVTVSRRQRKPGSSRTGRRKARK